MKIDQIMTIDPVCCTKSETAEVAASMMRDLNVGVIPIVENEKSYKIVGVVTDRDLCMSVVADGKDPKNTMLEDCMTGKLIFCAPEDDIEDVLKLMQKHQIRRIPVVDKENRIEGIVSTADIALHAKVSSQEMDQTIKEISKESEESDEMK